MAVVFKDWLPAVTVSVERHNLKLKLVCKPSVHVSVPLNVFVCLPRLYFYVNDDTNITYLSFLAFAACLTKATHHYVKLLVYVNSFH